MKVHGMLARAGKVKNMTPKGYKQDKPKKAKGRAKKRKLCNKMMNGQRNYNRTLFPKEHIAKKPQIRKEIMGSRFIDVPPSWWVQRDQKFTRFRIHPTKKKLGPNFRARQSDLKFFIQQKVAYCLSNNEEMHNNSFRTGKVFFQGKNFVPQKRIFRTIEDYSQPFSKNPRTFRRLPHLPDGLEISRINFAGAFMMWKRGRPRYSHEKKEIVVGANNKLYIQI